MKDLLKIVVGVIVLALCWFFFGAIIQLLGGYEVPSTIDAPDCEYKVGEYIKHEGSVYEILDTDCESFKVTSIDRTSFDYISIKKIEKLSQNERDTLEILLRRLFAGRYEEDHSNEDKQRLPRDHLQLVAHKQLRWINPNKTCDSNCLYWNVPDFMCTTKEHNHPSEEWIITD